MAQAETSEVAADNAKTARKTRNIGIFSDCARQSMKSSYCRLEVDVHLCFVGNGMRPPTQKQNLSDEGPISSPGRDSFALLLLRAAATRTARDVSSMCDTGVPRILWDSQ